MWTQNKIKQLDNIKVDDSKDVNILLLGETGVGKSTFINSIANYLHFQDFKNAEKEEPLILIPLIITFCDSNFEQKIIKIGKSDVHKSKEFGESVTQDVKTYIFPIRESKLRLRLIDTPGIGDTRGIKQDNLNLENILSYLSHLQKLHAICYFLKSNDTRIGEILEYSLRQILSRLEKSASKNLIFIFTNTRGTNYTGGETLCSLQRMIDRMHKRTPNIKIPLKNNIFSFDNEAFRFLIAIKNNIEIEERQRISCIESWDKSVKECWRMISYIIGDISQDPLKSVQIKNSVCINEARRLLLQLYKPLADVSELININIRIMKLHQERLSKSDESLDRLKTKLYIPVVNLQVIKLNQPITVCTAATCSTVYQVDDVIKWDYSKKCHDPCNLKHIPKQIIGDLALTGCSVMKNNVCQKCNCDFSVHMHVYYLTKSVEDKIISDTVQANMKDVTLLRKCIQGTIKQIETRTREYEEECNIIMKSLAKFAYFLQKNSLVPYEDSYKKYIEHLIEHAESIRLHAAVNEYKQLLNQFEKEKIAFEKILNDNNNTILIDTKPVDIMTCVSSLYLLKHNGKKIYELVKTQRTARLAEYNNLCEYIHPTFIAKPDEKGNATMVRKKKVETKKETDDKKNNKPTPEVAKKLANRLFSVLEKERPPSYHKINQQNYENFRSLRNIHISDRQSGEYYSLRNADSHRSNVYLNYHSSPNAETYVPLSWSSPDCRPPDYEDAHGSSSWHGPDLGRLRNCICGPSLGQAHNCDSLRNDSSSSWHEHDCRSLRNDGPLLSHGLNKQTGVPSRNINNSVQLGNYNACFCSERYHGDDGYESYCSYRHDNH